MDGYLTGTRAEGLPADMRGTLDDDDDDENHPQTTNRGLESRLMIANALVSMMHGLQMIRV
jgi:hypothetical protein